MARMFAAPEIPGYPFLARRLDRREHYDETSVFYVTGPTKADRCSLRTADPVEATKLYDVRRGKPVSVDRRIKVDEAWETWIAQVDLGKSTKKRYKGVYSKWAKDKIGNRSVADPAMRALVQECLNRIKDNGLSRSSYNNLHTALRSFFRDMTIDPTEYRHDIPVPSKPRKRRGKGKPQQKQMEVSQIITASEQQALLEGARRLWGHRTGIFEKRLAQMLLLITLLPRTGLRLSELLGLTWDDIKTPEGKQAYIDLTRQLSSEYRAEGDQETWWEALKTGEMIGDRARKVSLDDFALVALKRYQRLALTNGWTVFGGCIFTTSKHTPVSQSNMGKYFRQVVAASTVGRRVTPHFFRHTCASMLLKNGLSIEKVANSLGDRPETIQAVYAHIVEDDDFLAEVAQAIAS